MGFLSPQLGPIKNIVKLPKGTHVVFNCTQKKLKKSHGYACLMTTSVCLFQKKIQI